MKWAKIIISSSFYISFKANPSLSKPIKPYLFQKTLSLLSPALNGLSVRLNTVAPVVQPSCHSYERLYLFFLLQPPDLIIIEAFEYFFHNVYN